MTSPRALGQQQSDRLPGPDTSGYEDGWFFNDDGYDMSGVVSNPTPTTGNGNQLPGDSQWEPGWDFNNFGLDPNGMASLDTIPRANNMGIFSDMGSLVMPDVASSAGYHLVGPMPKDYWDGIHASDIIPAFNALEGNSPGAQGDLGMVMGTDSMAGIVLGAGSGPTKLGEQDMASTGNLGIDHVFPSALSGGDSMDQ